MKRFSFVAICIVLFISCSPNQDNNNQDSNMKSFINNGVEVQIPTDPKNIVADYYVGELLKLEANIIGADLTYKSSAWENILDDIVNVGQSLEKVMSLKPDLIITMKEDLVEQYRSIAPTVLIPYGTYNPEELIIELAKITNREDIAEKWLKQFNDNINELSELVGNKNETITIIDIWGDSAYLYGENYGRGGYILYDKLGFKGTESAEKDFIRKPDSYMALNIESLPAYSGDILLVMKSKDAFVSGSFFMDSVIWKSLEAVKNENVWYFNSEDFWFLDPYSLDVQVKILKDKFNDDI